MNAVRGRVRRGHVETDVALPEGAEVIILTPGSDEPFDLSDEEIADLESRVTAADAGNVDPAAIVFEKLRRAR